MLDKIGSTGMVPVFYHKDAEVAKKVVKACYDGGVRALNLQTVVTLLTKYLRKLEIRGKGVSRNGNGVGSIVDPATAALTFNWVLALW